MVMKSSESSFDLLKPVIMGDREFDRLGKFIMSQYGIKMPEVKKTFLQSRLQKRLKALNYGTFREYIDFIFSPEGQREELPRMIDAVSTHKTDFFREPLHFNFLLAEGLKNYFHHTGVQQVKVWSAGCSTGEEPYSIAMLLQEFSETNPGADYQILATDISQGVLEHATTGIYRTEKALPIPGSYKKKYLLRGRDQYKDRVRIIREIRSKVVFRQFNLLERNYAGLGKFDMVFCRNVLIYFNREVQYQILDQLCRQLNPGGYLFLGHSESIHGLDLPLSHLRPTVFMKQSRAK